MNGTLVTIEGIDKSGKTTAVEALHENFDDPVITTEPYEESWTGRWVRDVLQGEREADEFATFSMFLADHLNHVEELVGPSLEDGKLVICDRYIDSRYAYQQEVLEKVVEGDTLSWIQKLQQGKYTTTLLPDLTILLDITVEESFRRKGEDPSERFETREFLKKVRENYLELAKNNDRFVIIDGSPLDDNGDPLPPEQSKKKVRNAVVEAVLNNTDIEVA